MKTIRTWKRFQAKFRHTTLLALFLMLLGVALQVIRCRSGNYLVGVGCLWLLLVPCGVRSINRNSVLWWCRQIYFLSVAIFMLVFAT